MLTATPNEPLPLQILAADGVTSLYARANIYDATGALVVALPLPHIAEGYYGATWTPTNEGYFTAVSQFFTTADFSTPAAYDKGGDQIIVSSLKTNVSRLLGLQKENSVLDQEVYDTNGRCTQARLRCYDSKANAITAGVTGLLFQYTLKGSYTDGRLTQYLITREQ